MASEEEYITKLEEHGLTREEIDIKVKETIEKMKGWIDAKTALFVITKELGLEVDSQAIKQSSEQDYTIEQLSESTQNINVVGRVVDFSDIRTFKRKSGEQGQFSSFWIYDSKKQIKVLLWDERANRILDDSFKINSLVRVLNGQIRRNRDQNLEIHVGLRGDVEISPLDVDPSEYPVLDHSQFKVKISEITPNTSINKNMVTVEGVIDRIFEKRTVKKKATNEDLNVQRIIIQDDSGSIPVVFWENDTEILENVQEGATVLIQNLIAKPQYNDPEKLELTFKNGSKLSVKKQAKPLEIVPIGDIDSSFNRASVIGEIGMKSDVRKFAREGGEEGKVQRILLQDHTGSIFIVFWGKDTEKLENTDIGNKIKLENLSVQPYYQDKDRSELVFRPSSLLSIENKDHSSFINSIKPIEELLEKEGMYSFEGQITQIPDPLKTITTSEGKSLKVFSIHVSDNTGAIQLSFWEDQAEEFADLSEGESIRVTRARIKKSRMGATTASFGTYSALERNVDFTLTEPHIVSDFYSPSQSSKPLQFSGSYQPIATIDKEGKYEVKGHISKVNRIFTYEACAKCLKNISFEKTNCTCEEGPIKSEHRMILSSILEDNTGTIPLTFFGEDAENLIHQDALTIHVKRQDQDYPDFEKEIIDNLYMIDLVVIGTVTPSKYSQDASFEMKVDQFKIADLDEELDRLVNQIEK
ncbi:MAG: hypothetical protein JW776_03010 [Candidatus Lokiarchaeota archaeon]|nr:hypothetical protein [Candidatus Lokiarchaeota archaeon]